MASYSPRGTTQSRSPPPEALPTVIENGNMNPPPPSQPSGSRRGSLGFLRRSKSGEPLGDRKSSSGKHKKLSKEQAREEELRRQREAAIPKQPPKLPDLTPQPQLSSFGGAEGGRHGRGDVMPSRHTGGIPGYGIRAPSLPSSSAGGRPSDFDPYPRTESMAHRGRYSYASSAISTISSPRRVRRRKDPTPYNILVIGATNAGKTSFLDFLRKSLALPPEKRPIRSAEEVLDDMSRDSPPNANFISHYLETEIDNERIGLTLWDSQGLERNIVDLQLRDITGFLESKFEETLAEEMKVIRSPGVRDTHIHCAFLILDPARLDSNIAAAQKHAEKVAAGKKSNVRVVGGLDEDLDLQVIRTMQGKTTVVPVISKADTITTTHMAHLKKTVRDSLKRANLDPLEVLALDEQLSDDSGSGSLDHFDEREEDEMRGRQEMEYADRHTPDSETTPTRKTEGDHRRREATKQKSASSLSSSKSNPEFPFIPLSILSPDPHTLESKDEQIGRKFPWGFADPYNPEHCDFLKLTETVFGEWRADLREASREVWYERWRTSRLNRYGSNARNGRRSASGVGVRTVR